MGKNKKKKSRAWIVLLILIIIAGALYAQFGLTFVQTEGDKAFEIGGCDFEYDVHNDIGGGYCIRTEYYDFSKYDGTAESVRYLTNRSFTPSDDRKDEVNLHVESVYIPDGFEGITGKSAAELKKEAENEYSFEMSDEDNETVLINRNYQKLNIRIDDSVIAMICSTYGACSVSRTESKLPLCADFPKGRILAVIGLGEQGTTQIKVSELTRLEWKGDDAAIADYLSGNAAVIVVRLDPNGDTSKKSPVGEKLKARAGLYSKWKMVGNRLFAGSIEDMYREAYEAGRVDENGKEIVNNGTSGSSVAMSSDMAAMLSAYAMTMTDAQTVDTVDLPENSEELSIPLAKEALTLCTGHSKSGQAEVMLNSGFEILLQKGYDKKDTDTSHTCAFTVGRKLVDYYGQARTLLVVAVRGTNAGEWVSNFNFAQDHGDDAKYAENFLEAGENLYVNIIPLLADYPDALILVCGHSRGAAAANMLGMTLDDLRGKKDVFVYTFATPTTYRGEDGITGYENIFNFLNPADVVPHLPLEGWGFGHIGIDLVLPNERESIDRISGAMEDFLATAPTIGSYYSYSHSLTGSDDEVENPADCFTTYQIMLAMASSMTGVRFDGNGRRNMADMYAIMDGSKTATDSEYFELFSRLEKVIGRDGTWGMDIFGQHMPMAYTALIDAYGQILEQLPSMITPKMLSGKNLMDLSEDDFAQMLMPSFGPGADSGMYPEGMDLSGMYPEGMDLSGMYPEGMDLSGMYPEGMDLSGIYPEGMDLSGLNPDDLAEMGQGMSDMAPNGQ